MGDFYRHWDSPILKRSAKWRAHVVAREILAAVPARPPSTLWRGKTFVLTGNPTDILSHIALPGFGVEELRGDGTVVKVRSVS